MKTTNWLNYDFLPYEERRSFRNSFSVILADIDRENQIATVKGSGKEAYKTTLFDCTCRYYFTHQNQPCKHMFALAKALGIIRYDIRDLQKLDLYSYFMDDGIDEATRTKTVLNLIHESRVPTDDFVVYRFEDGCYAFGERSEYKTAAGKYRLALGLNCNKAFILGKNKNENDELVYGLFPHALMGFPKSCESVTAHKNGYVVNDFSPYSSQDYSMFYEDSFTRFCIEVFKRGQVTDKDIISTTASEDCKIYFNLFCLPDEKTGIKYEVTPLFEISTTQEFFFPFYCSLINGKDENNYYEFDVEDVNLD